MQLINEVNEINKIEEDVGILIGNFDGVHTGHQSMLSEVLSLSKKKKESLVLVTFRPHPAEILKNAKHFLINSYDERLELLKENGIKYIWEIDFNRDFSTLSPKEFMDQYLLKIKKLKSLYLGHDFAFGADKSGDHLFVKNYCRDKDIEPYIQSKFDVGGESVSSSIIRKYLSNSEMQKVNQCLGREFFLSGVIKKGAERGKTIGFPTANIAVDNRRVVPASGVYSTLVEIEGVIFKSVTNIGTNPTFTDSEDLNVETHILDFDKDIYGVQLKVMFLSKIREEMKFSSANDLVSQIKLDIQKRLLIK
ncbi:bifunctional riboflavin kinase/FAD synthetase [Bacteriovoracaceae bacterium]|nr:bifunctional riboflavin kinase/FAD synthetase [Bacteriovoracaceae bacterium]